MLVNPSRIFIFSRKRQLIFQVKFHKRLFMGGVVSGDLDSELLETENIHSPKEVDLPMNIILPWAVDIILNEAKRRQLGIDISKEL